MPQSLIPYRPEAPGLDVRPRAIGELKVKGRNARVHPPRQLEALTASIKTFGFTAPIIIGTDDEVLAGEARLEAARRAGLTIVPTISLAHLKRAQQKAYILADNRLAELASWDDDILKLELQDLSGLSIDFALDAIGFDSIELDRLLLGAPSSGDSDETESAAPEDALSAIEAKAISRVGDLWLLGEHRLACGDARDPDVYARLMAGEAARMVFTDPPYNVPVGGHITKRGAGREFPMASGEMSPAEFTGFLTETLALASNHALDGSIHYVFMDWRHMGEVLSAGLAAIGPLKNLIVWAKPNAGMGAFYRSQHELAFVFKKGDAPHINTFGLGDNGRYRTNVWRYPGASGFHKDRDADLAMHVTAKPVAMIADAILDVSLRGEVVLDPFGGSGSTLMAAEQTSRRARLIELDPLYCDVICRRFMAAGGTVTLEGGRDFETVAAERLAQTSTETSTEASTEDGA